MHRNIADIALAALTLYMCASLAGCERCDINRAGIVDLPGELEISDWPVYAGPCFIIQAPPTVELHSQWITHDIFGINAYLLNDTTHTLLFELGAGSHFAEPPERNHRQVEIAHFRAWIYEHRGSSHDSTTVQIRLPLEFPSQILVTHNERNNHIDDLVSQILSTIRVNNYHPGYPIGWDWREDSDVWIKMMPQNVDVPLPPKSSRDYPCPLREK